MMRTREALASLLLIGLVAAGCTSGGQDATSEPTDTASAQPTDDGAVIPLPAVEPDTGEQPPADPQDAVAGDQVAAVSMTVEEARDPFEPVREPVAGAEDSAGPDGAAVPTAPIGGGSVPTAPTGDVPVPSAPTGTPVPDGPTGGIVRDPDADTCAADPDACLTALRLIDAGTPPSGPGILQVGTTLFEVEVGGRFADTFVLLELRESCATIGHPDGVVERCLEPGSSLK